MVGTNYINLRYDCFLRVCNVTKCMRKGGCLCSVITSISLYIDKFMNVGISRWEWVLIFVILCGQGCKCKPKQVLA
jgi:hypothetical protein